MYRIFLNSTFRHIIKIQCRNGRISIGKIQLSLATSATPALGFAAVTFPLRKDSRKAFHYSSISRDKNSEKLQIPPESGNKSGVVGKLENFFGWLFAPSRYNVLTSCGINMYTSCVNEVDYDYFFKTLDLPDTFHSWFLILHLHVWMCLVRLKHEGKDGRVIYTEMVTTMWKDIQERAKLLGKSDAGTRNKSIRELHSQFIGMTIAYDIGILSDDHVLAAALWRNLITDKTNMDVVAIEKMLHYVRKQIYSIEQIDTEELIVSGYLSWGDPRLLLEDEIEDTSKELLELA